MTVRVFTLLLLGLMVGGFGLMTLCSGAFVFMAPLIAVPIGLVTGVLTWLCWRSLRGHQARAALSKESGGDAPRP
jgi:hypothetical protein